MTRMVLVATLYPPALLDELDEIVEKEYENRSEAIREAVRNLVKNKKVEA